MRSFFAVAAVAALFIAGPALAQKGGARKQPVAESELAPLAPLTSGMRVKDKNGVEIGEIVEVGPESAGFNRTVTIKMDDIVFAYNARELSFDEAAAYVNATQFQLRQVLRPSS